jgi:hypothetical protein
MAIIEGGTSATLAEVGAAAAKGIHVISKPQDYGTLGHYQVSVQTGAIGAGMAANGELFQLRWTDATRLCVIQKISCNGLFASTAFTAGALTIAATIARSFTASGTGGTALTLTGDNAQLRSSMGASLVGDARVSTTAALGAGTKTLDTQNIGLITTHTSGGTGSATPIIGSIYLPTTELFLCDTDSGEHPIVLAQNEGIVIRATVPATGVWTAGFTIKWAELSAF